MWEYNESIVVQGFLERGWSLSAGVGSPDGPGEEVDGQFGGAWLGYTTKFLIHWGSTELRTVSSLALKCNETKDKSPVDWHSAKNLGTELFHCQGTHQHVSTIL